MRAEVPHFLPALRAARVDKPRKEEAAKALVTLWGKSAAVCCDGGSGRPFHDLCCPVNEVVRALLPQSIRRAWWICGLRQCR